MSVRGANQFLQYRPFPSGSGSVSGSVSKIISPSRRDRQETLNSLQPMRLCESKFEQIAAAAHEDAPVNKKREAARRAGGPSAQRGQKHRREDRGREGGDLRFPLLLLYSRFLPFKNPYIMLQS